jgi:hypothetical protein
MDRRIAFATAIALGAAGLGGCRGMVWPGQLNGENPNAQRTQAPKKEEKKEEKKEDKKIEVKAEYVVRGPGSGPFAKPGFDTALVDGRVWIFRTGSKEAADFAKGLEPAKSVTRIGGGPEGRTVRAPDYETIDAYNLAVSP